MRMIRWVLLPSLVIALASCGDDGADGGAGSTVPDSTAGVSVTSGTPGTTMSPAVAEQMRSHLRRMEGLSGDSLLAMRDAHHQMVASMLSQMNQEIVGMEMPADSTLTAIADSVHRDLERIPNLNAAEMHALIPEHHRRVQRLITAHEEMMAQMGH